MSRTMKLGSIPISLLLLAVATLAGCGGGPAIHPVRGEVRLTDGNVAPLAGHLIEVAKVDDPNVRASGQIQPDGKFQLESLIDGKIRKGVLPGEYQARIVLSDDDPASRNAAAIAVHPKFFRFDTSGIQIAAPTTGAVQVDVLKR